MKKIFLISVLLFGFNCFVIANICPKVGLGDKRDEFEKVYGKPDHGPFFSDEKIERMVGYANNDMSVDFKEGVIFHFLLNSSEKLLTREEADLLIKEHIPSDSVLFDEIPTMINGQTVIMQSWKSEKLKEIFPELKDRIPTFTNFTGSISKDMKTGKITSIVIGLYRDVDKKAIKQSIEDDKKRVTEEKKRQEEWTKKNVPPEKELTPEEAEKQKQYDEMVRKKLEEAGL